MREDVLTLLRPRRGHFLLESGHHGELWLDLERLCLNVSPVRRLADELAESLAALAVEAICGPLVEGAFVALMVASTLDLPFTYAEPIRAPRVDRLYPIRYRLSGSLRDEVRGRRVAIVNDVINAGSAVRGTFVDLKACEAQVVAIGTLVVLGEWAQRFAADQHITLVTLATVANTIWEPAACPLCTEGLPLTEPSQDPSAV